MKVYFMKIKMLSPNPYLPIAKQNFPGRVFTPELHRELDRLYIYDVLARAYSRKFAAQVTR